ncbi:30S ribosomal protein S17 [Thiosulfativibrio zosterae]|jgi:small subunit ribosomal protein S17|uniref:Small ribosomal subunit protein uS17 n=1 Tax=Thiosulfativibrio zosterae TaxID=2675053 RepID=A0A6F8PKW8_9GAMM|nr:30S ribosomal protein S17 [Thiosulfativibrio zosterae]BBP42718.1 30S ribosomal protein S17 [Thiosulfativibrio zosterae]
MSGTETKARMMQGTVVSNSMQSSIVVKIDRFVKHPKYKKFIRKSTKVMAHDAENACEVGDTVSIKECRPLSKNKTWTLVSIDAKAKL